VEEYRPHEPSTSRRFQAKRAQPPLAIGMTGEAIAVSGGQSTDVHY